MNKIALIVSNNQWCCPYVNIYSRLLSRWGVPYEIISWDREGRKEGGIQYKNVEKGRNPIRVFFAFVKFSAFVKKTVKNNGYSRLIVFDSQLGIFLASFLKRNYRRKYIFDYRDLSIEQKRLFKNPFFNLLRYSYFNVISSPGFKNYLPPFDYVLCHNIDVKKAEESLQSEVIPYSGKEIKVLTIGAIRKDCNIEVINALGDKAGFVLSFVGKGPFSSDMEEYVKEKGYKNIVFKGYYKKDEEDSIIRDCSCINIAYPLIPSHISALSNRFYNSLIYRRPMIVTNGTIQGAYAKKFKVGLVINDCNDLAVALKEYLNEFDTVQYEESCKKLLSEIIKENNIFEHKLKHFLEKEF